MSQTKDLHTIPLHDLVEGTFESVLKINKEFIDEQNLEGIQNADLQIKVRFVKQSNLHTLSLQTKGTIQVECDRCLDVLNLPISQKQELIVKIGKPNDEFADDENVILVSPDDMELDLSPLITETILLSIPLRKVHKRTADCNAEMLKRIEQSAQSQKQETTDPRWDSLKNMFENLK